MEKNLLLAEAFEVATKFFCPSNIKNVSLISLGSINQTFVVEPKNKFAVDSFILQKISDIFKYPLNLITNHDLIIEHMNIKLSNSDNFSSLEGKTLWQLPTLLKNIVSGDKYVIYKDSYWRAMHKIKNGISFEKVKNCEQAKKIGYGLGYFHYLIDDMPSDHLLPSIEGFHDIKNYLYKYDIALSGFDSSRIDNLDLDEKFQKLIDFVYSKRIEIERNYHNISTSLIAKKIVHGDPKVSNFMFNTLTDNVISLIDLDTINFGYSQFDIADCLRSCSNRIVKNKEAFNDTFFDLNICKSVLEGYLTTNNNYSLHLNFIYLPEFTYIIIFELGLRFLTDYINGNIYFKVSSPSQNLFRAERQFQLFMSLESQWPSFVSVLDNFLEILSSE